jgi:hypothetical protein
MQTHDSSLTTKVAVYAGGVWAGLTTWAVLAQYVLSTRGHALGKLGAFHWVLLINVFPALLCAIGFAFGLTRLRAQAGTIGMRWPVVLAAGLVFPATVRLLRPVLDAFGAGMLPALAWCVLGSRLVAWLLARELPSRPAP